MSPQQSHPKTVRQVFGEQLRSTRNAANLTLRQLAQRLDAMGVVLDHAMLARIENHQRNVSLEESLAISAALDVAPSALIAARDDFDVAIAPQLIVRGDQVVRWLAGLRLVVGSSRMAERISKNRVRMLAWPPANLDPPLGDLEARHRWWLSQRSDRELRALDLPGFRDFYAALDRLLDLAGDPDLGADEPEAKVEAWQNLAHHLGDAAKSIDYMHRKATDLVERAETELAQRKKGARHGTR